MKRFLFLFVAIISTLPLHAQFITTIAGDGTVGFSGDGGPAIAAQLHNPQCVAVSANGTVYIGDNGHVRKISTSGVITTLASPGTITGIAVDAVGNVYFSNVFSWVVQKIDTSGAVSLFAGNYTGGFSGDGGPATSAQLNNPNGLAVDAAGNVYIAELYGYRVRKVNTSGIISTFAGNGSGVDLGDGGVAATSGVFEPIAVAADASGNVYIAEYHGHKIRKVNASGIISTFAGTGVSGFFGDGGAATLAKFDEPAGIAVDASGNVYVSDEINNRIRRINGFGIISTIAGDGTYGYAGDHGPATLAEFESPFGLSARGVGNLYIADYNGQRIRKISAADLAPYFVDGPVDSFEVCENSGPFSITSMLGVIDSDAGQVETWSLISGPLHGTAIVGYTTASTGGTLVPTVAAYAPTTGYSGNDTFQVKVSDSIKSDTITFYVKVKPLPDPGTISGASDICIGINDTLTESVSGGTWLVSNSNASVSTTGIVSGLAYGVDTIFYVVTSSGCDDTARMVVNVYPPYVTLSGPSAVCIGSVITLSGAPAGGAWSALNANATVTGGNVYGAVVGLDTILYTVSNVCGTITTGKEISVAAMGAPPVTIDAYPPTITAGESETLVATLTGGGGLPYQYEWLLNGTTIPGATDSTYTSSTLANGDSITCIVTNSACHNSSFSWIYVVVNAVGVNNVGAVFYNLALRPNPSNGRIYVTGMNALDNAPVSFKVTDILGNVLYRDVSVFTNRRFNKEIELPAGLANGMYVLQVEAGGERAVRRFLLSR